MLNAHRMGGTLRHPCSTTKLNNTMNTYKGITYWYNDMQNKYMAQIGYEIVAKAKTEAGIKSAITWYIKQND